MKLSKGFDDSWNFSSENYRHETTCSMILVWEDLLNSDMKLKTWFWSFILVYGIMLRTKIFIDFMLNLELSYLDCGLW